MLDRGMVTSQMFETMYSGIQHHPEVKKIIQEQTFIEEGKQYGFDKIGLNPTKPKKMVWLRKKTKYNDNVDTLKQPCI